MDLNLQGKTALVTGASKGIGRAIAKGLAAEGCNLHLAARTEADLVIAADDIRGRWNVTVTTHAVDLARSEDIATLAAACADIDILINNAGAIPRGTLTDLDEDAWREAWELKLFGYINLSRHIYGVMKERGSGVIVNVIGGAANNPRPDYIAGTAANVALDNFTVALGRESQAHGVRVVGMHPGSTRTERTAFLYEGKADRELGDKDRWQEVLPPLPFGRMTEPEEVADMVTFLASDRAGYTSGVVFSITGGI